MLSTLPPQAPDKIIKLMQQFRDDPRADKIDLGVGVYRTADGRTPVMRAIKTAEHQLWQAQETKGYTALEGDPAFHDAMRGLILGDAIGAERVAAAATVGGTGAVSQALQLARQANPDLRVWVPNPTWPNHLSILDFLGLPVQPYRYFDADARSVDIPGMLADLGAVRPGDLVLLHGCCHNPTGADPKPADWAAIAALLARTGATPLVDIAYQGFGEGLAQDAAATRLLAAELPELLIAASCSKNFGLYRERAGVLLAVCANTADQALAADTLTALNRLAYSFPPDHGARLVTMVLSEPDLRAEWEAELTAMRAGMQDLRRALAAELQRLSGSDRFAFLAQHRGMFSRLGATPEQVEALRRDHAIYMVGDSRMNIAGLSPATMPALARAILATGI